MEAENDPQDASCPLCGSDGDALVRCFGCETRYHAACVEKLGCTHAGCPLNGLRGTASMPQASAPWRFARWGWMASFACAAAAGLRASGTLLVPDCTFRDIAVGAVTAALSLTALAYARDLFTPAGRCLRRELWGRICILCGTLVLVLALRLRTYGLLAFGPALGLLGGVLDYSRPRRATHHPLRIGFSVLELMLVLGVIAVLAAIAIPGFHAARQRANTRACYANQKTIAGAMEMYSLDRSRSQPLSAALSMLKEAGYLQSLPQDPGEGPGTSSHYQGTSTGNGIRCTTHGTTQ